MSVFLANFLNNLAAGFVNSAAQQANVAATAVQNRLDQINAQRNLLNTVNNVDLSNESLKYYTNISIGSYSRRGTGLMGVNLTTSGGYKLPLPIQLVDTNSVNWVEEPIGTAAGMVASGLAGSEQAAQNVVESTIGTVGAIAANRSGGAGLAAQALAGMAPNEFLTLLFKGPTYKNFTLQFVVSPNTPELSVKYHQMILKFKNAMAPSLVGGGAVFTYPNLFQISFSGSDKLYEFKPSVLKSFSVDYAGSSVPSFYRGTNAPESYRLTMQFQEIEFWLAGQFTNS